MLPLLDWRSVAEADFVVTNSCFGNLLTVVSTSLLTKNDAADLKDPVFELVFNVPTG